MMTFDIVTIFPAMIEQPLAAGILGRAIERGTPVSRIEASWRPALAAFARARRPYLLYT